MAQDPAGPQAGAGEDEPVILLVEAGGTTITAELSEAAFARLLDRISRAGAEVAAALAGTAAEGTGETPARG